MTADITFTKGHGTGNDFVILPDLHGGLRLGPEQVRSLCHRRLGVGADGVLRVVSAEAAGAPDWMVVGAQWFMDYRNSDGTLAEMCGNGARVFARYLVEAGLEPAGEFVIGTRGGPRAVTAAGSGPVAVDMGPVTVQEPGAVTVKLDDASWSATAAFAPNPHAVVRVSSLADLGPIEASRALPDSEFPQGANVEFVAMQSPGRVSMRVNERGSGETLSCGTGACAAAAVHRVVDGFDGSTVAVAVPGGRVDVEFRTGSVVLSGPVEFVASGTLDPRWWASA